MRGGSSAKEMSVLAALIEQETGLKKFRYSDLKRATNNFSLERTVGFGPFGRVFRGVLDHQELAIKRLSIESEQQKREYITSVITTSELRHRNLVRIIGWCHERVDWLLIYEFIPNGDLKLHLHNRSENVLAWEIRLRVALGLASALHYLHEENAMCVVHRGVNPSNVRLDADFNAKLGGFGSALRLDHETSLADAQPVGTFAYISPETFHGVIGKECDVYSFGVVALEIASGRRPFVSLFSDSEEQGRRSFVEMVKSLHAEGLLLEAADERLNMFEKSQMKSLLVAGLWCVQTDPKLRPSMGQVINVLKGEVPLPEVPAFEVPAGMYDIYDVPSPDSPAYGLLSGMDAMEEDGAEAPLPRLSAHHVVRAGMNETEVRVAEPSWPYSPKYEVPMEMADDEAAIDVEIEKEKVPMMFTYSDLAQATENFSDERKIGEGGFGAVYKGLLNGEQVAIKRVWGGSKHGKKQYIAEIKAISDLRHGNLVRLVGYCHEQRDFLLVYQFIPNGDLKSHLYSEENVLAWRDRFKIALGLASALYYLHEQYSKCVWHRDVKSSNVMLDADFNAKLGDFGLALLLDHNVTSELTNPAGTLGYWAPEIFDGKARKESDVYSFGIVALEIACGRKPIVDDDEEPGSKMHLVEWVRRRYVKGLILEAADKRLSKLFEEKQMKSLLIVGLWCAQRDYRLHLCDR